MSAGGSCLEQAWCVCVVCSSFRDTLLDYGVREFSATFLCLSVPCQCQHVRCMNEPINMRACVVAVPTAFLAWYQHGGRTTNYPNAGCTLQPPITPTTTKLLAGGLGPVRTSRNQDPSSSCASNTVDLLDDDTEPTGRNWKLTSPSDLDPLHWPPLFRLSCPPRVC